MPRAFQISHGLNPAKMIVLLHDNDSFSTLDAKDFQHFNWHNFKPGDKVYIDDIETNPLTGQIIFAPVYIFRGAANNCIFLTLK